MEIKLNRVFEYYDVVIPEGEDDPGTYSVKREVGHDVWYEVRLQGEKVYQKMSVRSRPYQNITKAIEKRLREKQNRSVRRQERLIERSVST